MPVTAKHHGLSVRTGAAAAQRRASPLAATAPSMENQNTTHHQLLQRYHQQAQIYP